MKWLAVSFNLAVLWAFQNTSPWAWLAWVVVWIVVALSSVPLRRTGPSEATLALKGGGR